MINVSGFISPFFETIFFFKADSLGRKTILLIMGPLGIFGTAIGLMFNNLAAITIFMLFSSIYYSIIFSLNFIFFNEMVIDPLRSKASGIKSFSLTLGTLCKNLKIYKILINFNNF